MEAVLYTARVGNPWRDLPAEFGNWHSVYVRFARWEMYGVWHRVAEALSGEADLEELFIDSTVVRAHQHAAGAPKKTVAMCMLMKARVRVIGGFHTGLQAAYQSPSKASA